MGTKRNPEWWESPEEEEGKREMRAEKSGMVRYLESIPRAIERNCGFFSRVVRWPDLSVEDDTKHIIPWIILHFLRVSHIHSFTHSFNT